MAETPAHRLVAVLALLAAAASCSKSGAPHRAARRIALLDPRIPHEISSPLRIDQRARTRRWSAPLLAPDGKTFFVGGLDYLRRGAAHLPWIHLPEAQEGGAPAPSEPREGRLTLRPPCAVVVRVGAERARGAVLRVLGRGTFRGASLGVWVSRRDEEVDLADPRAVQAALGRRIGGSDHPAPHQEGERFSLTVPLEPPDGAAAYLFLLAVRTPVELEEVSLLAVPRWRTALLAVDERGPRPVRYVALGPDHRESLLLQAPGRARFALRSLPPSPRLRFAAARLQGEAPCRLRVRWIGREDRELAVLEVDASERFVEHDLPLPAEAREGGTLEFDWQGGGAAVVAVAHPEIVPARRPAGAPPDIVLVSLDTVRADRVAGFGGRPQLTPTIASLLERGIRFETAIAPSSWTLPSHTSLFTGWNVPHHGVDAPDRRLAGEGPATLAETLRAAGYRTISFNAGGFVHADFGLARGFDRYVCRELVGVEVVDGKARRTDEPLAAELLEKLREERAAPTFFFLHTYAAHEYLPENEDLRAVGAPPEAGRLRGHFQPALAASRRALLRSDDERRRYEAAVRALYEASVHLADRWLGEIVAALSAAPGSEVWLVVTSDHGEELFEFGRVGHNRSLSEPLLHVPLLFVPPASEAESFPARRVPDVVSLVDLLPTLLDLAGAPPAGGPPRDGRSLVPLLRGDPLPARPAFAAIRDLAALRGPRFKWIEGREPEGRAVRRLVDLVEDPHERADASARHPDLVRRMERALQALRRSGGAAATHGELSPERRRELEALGYLGDD